MTPAYSSRVTLAGTKTGTGAITQMAWGPDGRLYAARHNGGAVSFAYDSVTGSIGDPETASAINGTGLAFHPGRGEMYLVETSRIWRLTDDDGDHDWGESGETRVAIVTDIPVGFHTVDQLQIVGNTLVVGIGTTTSDGGTGTWPSEPFGECAYGGTIAWIEDLTLVANTTDAARLLGAESQSTIQTDATPYTSTDPAKLRVHSAGARNPFGLAVDASGQLFFTNNYNRATTNGDGTSSINGPNDALGVDFTTQVHDQFFRAIAGADYGFRNDNWRGVRDPAYIAAILDPAAPGYKRVSSITPDNLQASDANYLQLHNPAAPVGLGPSASADGFAFWNAPALPPGLKGAAFIVRWTGTVTEASPGTDSLTYCDLIAVDSNTGDATRIADNFVHPLAVLVDVAGRLLVADFGAGSIHVFTASAGADDDISVFWRHRHFGHPFGEAADKSRADDDPDGDGCTNFEEFLTGTLPLQAASAYRITSIEVDGTDIAVTFSTMTGRSYRLERRDDLAAGDWSGVGEILVGTGGPVTVHDSGAALLPRRFYRVRVALP